MAKGILPFGSGDASIIFEDDLKDVLTDAEIPSYWGTGLRVGSDSLGWLTEGAATHFPTHDATLGMKQVSSIDGSTECGYRLLGGQSDATLVALGFSGSASIQVESSWLDAYSATYNAGATQPDGQVLLSAFSGSGVDNMYFARHISTDNAVFYAAAAHAAPTEDRQINKPFNGFELDQTAGADPRIYADMYGRGRFVRLTWAWNGNFGYLFLEDVDDDTGKPDDKGPIMLGWGRRDVVSGFAEHFAELMFAGLNGSANTFLTGHYIRDFTISTHFPTFGRSSKCPVVIGISDSMLDPVSTGSERAGGCNNSITGVERAFLSLGMYTKCEFVELGGGRVREDIVVTPSSITQTGTTVTIVTATDPGWQTNDNIAIAGCVPKAYNGVHQVTRISGNSYQYTLAAQSITTASGTITAGRSLQPLAKHMCDSYPMAAGAVIHGGTNDLNGALQLSAADLLTDYKSLIDKIFAYDNIKFIIAVIPPARQTGGDLDLQEEYNSDVFGALEAYVAANYPTKVIELADVWTLTGGRTQPDNTLDSDNTHYAPYGASCLHEELRKATRRALAQI